MKINFTAKDIMEATEVHLHNGTLYIVFGGDAYGFNRKSREWYLKDNFWDYFDSELMMSCFEPITKEGAVKLYIEWINKDNERLDAAIKFAVDRHAGQLRKGTTNSYIRHPLEAMIILQSMNADIDLQIAGVLHDTVEDTDTTEEELRQLFGDEVADLVCAHSEDKSKTWEERKTHAIKELAEGDKRFKMLVMADKVSNLRAILKDYREFGDELWTRFNAPATKQAWYYSEIQDALWDMQNYPECAELYWEMVGTYKDVFVKMYHHEESDRLFQVCLDGSRHYLCKGNPEWKELESELPESAKLIDRKTLERMEDEWNVPFWQMHEKDCSDGEYDLFVSTRRSFSIEIKNGKLTLYCDDFGPECEMINGKDGYEFWYKLNRDNTQRFLARFRLVYGFEGSIGELLKKVFGEDNGPMMFRSFCHENIVEYDFFSY